MIKITLIRGMWQYDKSQVGLIYPVTMNPLFVLELIDTFVKPGSYKCVRMPSTKNGKWKEAFFIKDVPGHSAVICGHIGNEPKDSRGCMLFGLYHDGPNHIKNSTGAIYKWRDAMRTYNEFELEIT